MEHDQAANALAALGNTIRLDIYRTLLRAGHSGLNISELQEKIDDVPRSTLNHHLQKLAQAGLVSQQKVSSNVINHANFATMDSLIVYLTDECCSEETAQDCC